MVLQLNIPFTFSESQQQTLAIVSIISGCLAILGSLCMFVWLLQEKQSSVYNRLMLGISSYDLIYGILYATSTLAMPVNTPGVWRPQGNRQTCLAHGFFTQFGTFSADFFLIRAFLLTYKTRFVSQASVCPCTW